MAEKEEEVAFDERFEFDAPQFYDFDEGSPPEKAPADGWFDTDGPKGLATPPKQHNEQQQDRKPAACAAAGAPENVNPQQQDRKPAACAAAGAPENVNPQQQGEAAGKAASGKGKEWRRALASISNTTSGKAAQQPQQQGSKRKATAGAAGEAAGSAAAAAAAGPSSSKARPGSAAVAKLQAQDRPASRQAKASAAAAAAAAPTSQATSPRLHSRQRAHTGEQKSSEQLELERLEQEKAAAAALRRHNAETVKHVLGAPPPPVVHSSRPLTEPVELELCTSKRRRMHSMETRSMASPFKSTAEQIAAFEGRLPSKSKLGNSSGKAAPAPQQQQQQHGGHHGAALTVPQSPRFATKQRVRPPRFKPREVVEAEEMAAMPKFKARPVNKRILHDRSGHLGVPHVDVKPPTVPAPFALRTDQRAAEHAGSAGAGYHAGSSAAATSAGADGIFVFAATGGEGGRVTRSKAAAKKARQSGWTGQLTQPEPFQLATDARGAAKRSAATEAQHEEQARPSKRARRSVAQGPFQLATDARGTAEEARLEGIRRQQEEQARRNAEFKALPLNCAALAGAWKPPAVVPPSLTIPQEVALHSDARAERRRAFDEAVAAKQAEQETERQQAQALQAVAEEEEVRQLRKRMVPKALPLPDRL
ncbi:hypothetical protein ABPG75_012997 [Micractinium tetrahymenae]